MYRNSTMQITGDPRTTIDTLLGYASLCWSETEESIVVVKHDNRYNNTKYTECRGNKPTGQDQMSRKKFHYKINIVWVSMHHLISYMKYLCIH